MSARPVALLLFVLSTACFEAVTTAPEDGSCQSAADCATGEGCVGLRCGDCLGDGDCADEQVCRQGSCTSSPMQLCQEAATPCGSTLDPVTGERIDCAQLGACDEVRQGDVCFAGACCTSTCGDLPCGASSCGASCIANCSAAEMLVGLSEVEVPPIDRPIGRTFGAFAVDPATGRGLLFGGLNKRELHLDDTWLLSGDPPVWRRLSPTVSPAGRHGASMVWDAPRARWLLLLGERAWVEGLCARDERNADPGCLTSEVWAFEPGDEAESATWTLVTPFAAPPPGRVDASIAADPVSGELLLFGGSLAFIAQQETWRLWFEPDDQKLHVEPLSPPVVPPARERASLTADGASLLLIGGRSARGQPGVELGDQWRWEGGTWRLEEPLGQAPTPRAGHAAIWLEGIGLVVVGGVDDESATSDDPYLDDVLWLRSAETGAWMEVPQGRAIGGREEPVLAPSHSGDGIVVGLGRDSTRWRDDLWRWNP